LGVSVAGDSPIIVKFDPFCGAVEPIANWDVEVGDLIVVEDIPHRWLLEGILIVEDGLLQGMDLVFILLGGNSSLDLPVGNGLEEAIGDLLEEGCIDVIIDLKCGGHCP
jgi:hypothetical protein